MIIRSEKDERTWAVDLSELLHQVEQDRELVIEMTQLFRVEFPRVVRSLRAAMSASDLDGVRIGSHTAKGMLANLACKQAAASAAKLEHIATRGAVGDIAEAIEALERQGADALRELEAYCCRGHQ